MTRIEEKNTLIHLNNRFAAIIDRNHQLEGDNAKLAAQVGTIDLNYIYVYIYIVKTSAYSFINDHYLLLIRYNRSRPH